ncbi:hypothetical protein NCF85_16020 (plasmid) [Qipengyuania citrea]|uniref:Deoxycytidine triphosphate deaminase n=1 Tax=Qipengyuania citrea TaxID=225971 RepID=A0ABY4UA43_9SPHN|nr:hypothetical protein [Qipengyuania citrea]USA62992.1 hypothetical protein NCF85_16020 [Qipengyuania citrea]
MGFWSGAEILRNAEKEDILTPFSEHRIDCSAYTLTMGSEYYITPSENLKFEPHIKQYLHPKHRLVGEDGKDVLDEKGLCVEQMGGSFQIPPGQFGFLLTQEFIRMPPDTMGFISLKSSAKFKGLINVSGFHVDPGFQGHLIFSVFNAGPSTITFERGQELFLIWFADLEGESQEAIEKFARRGKPPLAEIGPQIIGEVSGEMVSLESLSRRIDRIDPQISLIKTLTYSFVTAALLIIGLLTLTNLRLSFGLDKSDPHHITE